MTKEPHLYRALYEITPQPDGTVTYTAKPVPEGVTKDQIPEAHGAADALFLVSIMGATGGPDGYSTQMVGIRGKDGMEGNELFQIWTLLAKAIADTPTTSPAKRQLCEQIFEHIRQIIVTPRS